MAARKVTTPRKATTPRKTAPRAPVDSPPGRASKEALLAPRAATPTGYPEAEVEVAGFGTVLVRGLSRFEVLHLQNGPRSTVSMEQRTIALGMIDPVMSEDEVKAWQIAAGPSELDDVSETIGRLSGLVDKAVKKAYTEFEEDPGSEFRLLSGEGTENDGGSPAG